MTNNILNKIKGIIEEHEEYQDNNEYKTQKIYTDAWNFVLNQFNREYNKEYYLLPLIFFTKYDKNNKEIINNAIKLLIKDGFQTITDSNIQALKISRSEIIKLANINNKNKTLKK